jgi:hypothetical protein
MSGAQLSLATLTTSLFEQTTVILIKVSMSRIYIDVCAMPPLDRIYCADDTRVSYCSYAGDDTAAAISLRVVLVPVTSGMSCSS